MQSQLEWDQRKFIKFEMNEWSRVFQIAMKGQKVGWKFCLNEFLTIQCFCHAEDKIQQPSINQNQHDMSVHKAWNWKKWYNSNNCSNKWNVYWVITRKMLFGEGDFLVRELSFIFAAGRDSSPIYRVAPNVWRIEQSSPNMVGTTGRMKREGTFLVRWGIQGV